MDFGTVIERFCAIVLTAGGTGAAFDSIYTTRVQRQKIRQFLRERTSTKTLQEMVTEFIQLVNDSVFERYFAAPFLSWAYFRNTSILSTLFLAIILLTQLSLGGEFQDYRVDWSASQIILIAFCYLANLVVDWISIGQTQFFFRVAADQRRPSQAAILIIADLIVTVNVFAIVFAGALTIPILITRTSPLDVEISTTAHYVEPTFVVEKNRKVPWSDIISRVHHEGLPPSILDLTRSIRFDYGIVSYPDIETDSSVTLRDLLNATTEITGLRAISGSTSPAVPEKAATLPYTSLWYLIFYKRKMPIVASAWRQSERVRIHSAFSLSAQDISDAFRSAYVESGVNQYDMFESITTRLQFVSFRSFVNSTTRSSLITSGYGFGDATELVGCEMADKGKAVWNLQATNIEIPTACRRRFLTSRESLTDLTRDLHERFGPFSKSVVPTNSFFLTSMMMTALIYLFSLLLFTAKLFWRGILHRLISIEPIVMRSPLAVTSLFIGFALFLISFV